MKSWLILSFTLISFLFNPVTIPRSFAQNDSEDPNYSEKKNSRLDLSVGLGQKCNLNTFQWVQFKALDKENRFNLGGGFRFSNFNYNQTRKSIRGESESGFTSFSAKGNILALNVMVAAEFLWQNKFGIGANIDFAGFSIGSVTPSYDSTDYRYTPVNGIANPGTTPGDVGAEPTGANILLGAKKDQGTLNSEIYGVAKLQRRAWIKVGFSHVYSGLVLSQPEDRFGSYSNVYFIGLRFKY